MAFFSKFYPQKRLTSNTVDVVVRFGKNAMNPFGNHPSLDWSEVSPLWELANQDPEWFTQQLADLVIARGGWAVYGSAMLLLDIASDNLKGSCSQNIMSGALKFLRENGVPQSCVAFYLWDFWLENRSPNEKWLPFLSLPDPQSVVISPLKENEIRKVAQYGKSQNSNMVFVKQNSDGSFTAEIEAQESREDMTRSRWNWKTTSTLFDLYSEIGFANQVPHYWYDPELKPFYPLPESRIDLYE